MTTTTGQGHEMAQGNHTVRNVRRRVTTVAAAAVLAGGLGGCGPVAEDPTAAPVTAPERTTQSVPAATSTSTPGTSAPAPTTTPTPTASASVAPGTSVPAPTRTPASTPVSTPDRTPTPTPTPTATKRPTPSTPPPTSTPPRPTPSATPQPEQPVREDLRVGDRGPSVLALQQRLSELGYWLGEPDGEFGFLTQQAVWALQKSAGLSRDGSVGPRTTRALDDGVRPTTRLSGNGIDIDLARQVLLVVRDGRVKYILNTSTGGGYTYERKDGSTGTARTPKGTFSVYYTVDGRDEGFLGDMWRPRYFHGGYAVHGSPSIPAYPASHGCARVSNAAMNLIWARDYMPKGSTVLVR